MNLGARLKAERERLGLSQTDFAALAGASKHAQINWEKGVAAPNAIALAAWSEAGLDVLYVVTGQRSRPLSPAPGDTVSGLVRGKALRESGLSSGGVAKELKLGEVLKDLTLGDAINDLTLGKALRDSGVLLGSALEQAGLNRREQTLLANYRGSDERGRKAIEGAASELSHKDGDKSKQQGGE